MKKHFILLSLLLFLAFITTACGGAGGSSGACDFYGYISQLTLSKYAFTIQKGSTDNVIAYVDGVDKTKEVTFTLQSEKSTHKGTITTVDKGLIKHNLTRLSLLLSLIHYFQHSKPFQMNSSCYLVIMPIMRK